MGVRTHTHVLSGLTHSSHLSASKESTIKAVRTVAAGENPAVLWPVLTSLLLVVALVALAARTTFRRRDL